MKLDIYQVDAFSQGPFTGNPAAVIPLENWLSDKQMQQIAEENNLSETAFFVSMEDHYHIRWFTPTVEVALCGHATLATASILFDHLRHEGDIIHFNCKSGSISVAKKEDLLTLNFPTDHLQQLEIIPDGLGEALGITPTETYAGREDLLCVIKSQNLLGALKPDFYRLSKIGQRGVIVTAQGDGDYDFVSRCFFPQFGIDEDPATGSAHTTLTPYWSKRLGKTRLNACQLSRRKGFFHCMDKGARTLISGKADLYLKGQIWI